MRETALQIPGDGVTLEGSLTTPDGEGPFAAVVLCHPHPQYGGDMHNNVVDAVARALVERGIAALRFNFRGVGGSGGTHGAGLDERDDVRAALACARTAPRIDAARVGLAGYSFGAAMAAGAVDPAVAALALVAVPTRMVADESGGGPARSLRAYSGPRLLIAGEGDQFCPPDELRALAGSLQGTMQDTVQTHIVEGADHFWFGHEREVAGAVGDFFASALAALPEPSHDA